jgi:hypothetical protein
MPQAQVDKPQATAVQYVGSENAFSLYVNSAEMGLSGWDVRMKLGEIVGQAEDGRAIVKNLGTIVMSPAHAKAVLEALQKTVRIYEEKFGEIDLARIQAGGTATP